MRLTGTGAVLGVSMRRWREVGMPHGSGECRCSALGPPSLRSPAQGSVGLAASQCDLGDGGGN
jgi:hypothetical protein